MLDGQPAYDMSFEAAGGFGLFYYPPTFIPLVLPFGLLPAGGARPGPGSRVLLAAFGVGRRGDAGRAAGSAGSRCCWPGVSWPFLYSIKLGQVGPLLFLLFALGWRWLDRGPLLGRDGRARGGDQDAAGAGAVLGAAHPALVGGRRGRRRARSSIAGLATLVAGLGAWTDFLVLIGRVSDPITTPKNLTPGAVAYGLGVSRRGREPRPVGVDGGGAASRWS